MSVPLENVTLEDMAGTQWRKPHFIQNPLLRWGLIIGTVIYLVLAFGSIEVNWSRVYQGLDRGRKYIAAFANPDFGSRASDIKEGMIESVIMTVTSTIVGIATMISFKARETETKSSWRSCLWRLSALARWQDS